MRILGIPHCVSRPLGPRSAARRRPVCPTQCEESSHNGYLTWQAIGVQSVADRLNPQKGGARIPDFGYGRRRAGLASPAVQRLFSMFRRSPGLRYADSAHRRCSSLHIDPSALRGPSEHAGIRLLAALSGSLPWGFSHPRSLLAGSSKCHATRATTLSLSWRCSARWMR